MKVKFSREVSCSRFPMEVMVQDYLNEKFYSLGVVMYRRN